MPIETVYYGEVPSWGSDKTIGFYPSLSSAQHDIINRIDDLPTPVEIWKITMVNLPFGWVLNRRILVGEIVPRF